jgi:hypothetical protein
MTRHNAWSSPVSTLVSRDANRGPDGHLPVFLRASSRVRRTDRCPRTERLYAAVMIVRVSLERRPEDDVDELRAYAWGDGRFAGLLLADESGAVVRAEAGRHDPADGFVTAAILLRDRVRQGEWPERLSYDSTEQRPDPAQPPSRPPVKRRGPTRSGVGLGTLAERARRSQSEWPGVGNRTVTVRRVPRSPSEPQRQRRA